MSNEISTEGRHPRLCAADRRYGDGFAMARLHLDPPAAALAARGDPT
jgi:hypothetical protein